MLTTPSTTTYSTDGSIKITCNYEGTTSGTMEWYYNSQKLEDAADDAITINPGSLQSNAQQYTLTITDVTPPDNAGSYSCVLSFTDGDSLRASTDLVVRKSSSVDKAGTAESTIVVTDDELSARCQMEGDKVPSGVTWTRGGNNIVFDGSTKIENTNTKQLESSVKFFSNITIKSFNFADADTYICSFTFGDGNNVQSTIEVVSAKITNNECEFVDFRTEASKTLTCTYRGGSAATAVSFTLPDNSVVAGVLAEFSAGGDASTAGSQTGTYAVSSVSEASSGSYKCTFTLTGGKTVSAIQRLTARSK